MAPIRMMNVWTMQFAESNFLAEIERNTKSPVRYAILSHRWLADKDEVQYDDIKSLEKHSRKELGFEHKLGYAKLRNSCRLAREQGLEFVWLDTCCINKSNPAELQESINSMYRWYEESAVCYAYLKDTDRSVPNSMELDEWFTRGWTLQELIAPRRVQFYDAIWVPLGNKSDLKDRISSITKIDVGILGGEVALDDYSVAARLSWASNRQTGKVEDQAYSLLGILRVNMPMLYGEGAKSFSRLQEEFIKSSDDHSIFAWTGVCNGRPGLLAQSLDNFRNCGSVKCTSFRKGKGAFFMTNRGMSITLNLTQWTLDTYLARIHCVDMAHKGHDTQGGMTGIFLRRWLGDDQYARVHIEGQEIVHDLSPPPNWDQHKFDGYSREVQIFVRQASFVVPELLVPKIALGFKFDEGSLCNHADRAKMFRLVGSAKGLLWDETERTLVLQPGVPYIDMLAHLDISKQGLKIKEIKLGFDFDFNPIIFLAESSAIGVKSSPLLSESLVYPEEEKQSWLAFAERMPHYSHPQSWNKFNQSVALKNTIRSGLWQLRGDRINGLDVVLGDTEVRVVMSKIGTIYGRICWELRFENMLQSRV